MEPSEWRRVKPGSLVDPRSFAVHTLNQSGWGPVKKYLMALHQQDVFVLVQEHRLFDADLPEAQTWLEANGWQGVFHPCGRGAGRRCL